MKAEKASFRLALNLGFAYTMYVMGKMSFSAATVGIIDAGILTKTETGIISGVFWFVYAMGQIVGAFIGNKISPYLLIEIAIVGSATSNILMACTENFAIMLIVWCLGGASQFGLWPALLKLTAGTVGKQHRPALMSFLAYSYTIASVMNYFLTAWILSVLSWKYIFIICGIICGAALPGMIYVQKKVDPVLQVEPRQEKVAETKKGKLTGKIVWERALLFFALLMCMQSVVTNGIGNWMPTILLELYGVSSSHSSLLSVIRLGITLLGISLGILVYEKMKTDELRSLIVIYVPLIPIMLLLTHVINLSVYVTITLLFAGTILLGASGARLSLNYPARYQDIGCTATVGAIINCMSTGGMAIATYGGGYLADHFGWEAVIYMWNILVILFVVMAVCILPLWNRFKQSCGFRLQ